MTRTAVTLVPGDAITRDLRVTDIRCHAEGCGAGPGQVCRESAVGLRWEAAHPSRLAEFKALVAAGWRWQEPQSKAVHVERSPVLCYARVRSPSGATWFCSLADGHEGDHHGLSRGELAQADFGPTRRKA